jgi:hypothetical protein
MKTMDTATLYFKALEKENYNDITSAATKEAKVCVRLAFNVGDTHEDIFYWRFRDKSQLAVRRTEQGCVRLKDPLEKGFPKDASTLKPA